MGVHKPWRVTMVYEESTLNVKPGWDGFICNLWKKSWIHCGRESLGKGLEVVKEKWVVGPMEDEDRLYRLNGIAHVAGNIDEESKVKQMTMCYTWFHERFRVLPADATDETVRVYARAYILMLLSSQLFADKNANRVHLRWLPYLASLDDLGRYSWGSAALAWLYRCLCRGTNRNVVNLAGPLHLLQSWIFWRFPTLRPTGFDRFGFPLASRWAEFVPRNDAGAQRLVSARLALDRLPCGAQDPRPIVLTEEARHRGSSQAPPRVHVYDRPDNRRVDRRRRIGTRTTDREWREFADRLEQDVPGAEAGDPVDYRVPRRRGRRPPTRPDRRGGPDGGPSEQGGGTGHVAAEDVVGSASAMDQPTFDVGSSSQMFGNVSPYGFAEFTTATVGVDIADPVTESEFYRDIADMLRDDDQTHYRPQMPEEHGQFGAQQPGSDDVQAQLAVDLNEPAVSPSDPWFALGGTPASAFSAAPAHPTAPAPDQRPRRVRRPTLCGTGGHLLGQFDDDDSDTIEDSD
ncbi:hypothetical protein Ahy_B08g089133 [Arachis hypogaea]|uniref:Aminotransferase-like plant mobile domain-containing protein n=1 Tax=Arachis hypogaea TaxID=3818 RepID=A0A444XWS7_ARAHY|nr:hypothetical protein Ahy_B08g089133 [Arachis hypogaea]